MQQRTPGPMAIPMPGVPSRPDNRQPPTAGHQHFGEQRRRVVHEAHLHRGQGRRHRTGATVGGLDGRLGWSVGAAVRHHTDAWLENPLGSGWRGWVGWHRAGWRLVKRSDGVCRSGWDGRARLAALRGCSIWQQLAAAVGGRSVRGGVGWSAGGHGRRAGGPHRRTPPHHTTSPHHASAPSTPTSAPSTVHTSTPASAPSAPS